MLPHPKLISVAGIILLTALATPALAGTLYKWTAEDGSMAFTDDAKRVPERYRSQVKTIQTGGLDDYQRFTPEDSAAVASQRADLAARLERLRERSAVTAVTPVAAPQRAPGGTVSETLVQVDDETAVRIPVAGSDDDEPIVVEELRVLRDGSNFTVHDTVVRQGDKVLMVVRPESRWPVRADYIDEDDLFE
jgi:hypothetical protein